MVKFKALHRLFGKIRMKKTEESDNSVSHGGNSPRGSIWRKRSFASPTNGSRSNCSGRKVKLLTVISSLFKTSKGKPMSNDGGKDDKPQVEDVLNATIDDVIECDSISYGSLSSLCTISSADTQQRNTEEVNILLTQTVLDWQLTCNSVTSLSSLSSLTNVTELSECFPSELSLTEDDFSSNHGEINIHAYRLAAAGDLKQITRKGNDVGKDVDVTFWKRYMLAVCIVFVLLLLI